MEGLYWSEGFTLVPGLRRLRNPTLVIHGDYDVVPVEHVAQVAGAIPGARRECFANAGISRISRARRACAARWKSSLRAADFRRR